MPDFSVKSDGRELRDVLHLRVVDDGDVDRAAPAASADPNPRRRRRRSRRRRPRRRRARQRSANGAPSSLISILLLGPAGMSLRTQQLIPWLLLGVKPILGIYQHVSHACSCVFILCLDARPVGLATAIELRPGPPRRDPRTAGSPCPRTTARRLAPRIVHVGVGGFHRAHLAVYAHELAAARAATGASSASGCSPHDAEMGPR